MFRLATFNVFAHNRDDHNKKFSSIMNSQGKWCVSPAYDVVFSNGPGGEHSTSIMGEGLLPGTTDLLNLANGIDIDSITAHTIIQQVKEAISHWTGHVKDAGVSTVSQQQINKILETIG